MIEIGKTIVSIDVIKKEFVCNLEACKGACCIEGDSGAPLTDEERDRLESIYDKVKPHMRPEGIEAVYALGTSVYNEQDREYETPLIKGAECAYVIFDEKGTAMCAIEQAHRAGKTDFIKPISCHLYPIRIKQYRDFDAVNYDRWDICSDACSLGKELNIPVYRFVKEALIRKYGKAWYDELEKTAKEI